jgi:antitoxin HicB
LVIIIGLDSQGYPVSIKIEKLDEGVYLATSDSLQGLVAQGRTIAETVEIAKDVARKLIEMHKEQRDLLPEVLPSGRIDAVVEMYKSHEISLSRAAEIAGVCFEEFKEILAIKGITRVVEAPCEEEMQRRVDLILGRTR